jgi:hypothetical protein
MSATSSHERAATEDFDLTIVASIDTAAAGLGQSRTTSTIPSHSDGDPVTLRSPALSSLIRSRKVTSDQMRILGDPTFNPVTRTLSGGDGIRTHGLYIANV